MEKPAVIIFGKSSQAQSVKTRLAKTKGSEFARTFYLECLSYVLEELEHLPKHIKKFFFVEGELGSLTDPSLGSFEKRAQIHGTLTDKISQATAQIFKEGYSSVTILGSDTPDLSCNEVLKAIELLEDNDFILGPNYDGGYYLLSQRLLSLGVYRDIDWSTPKVLDQTLHRIKELDLSVKVLNKLYDIDTESDLYNWLNSESSKSDSLKIKYKNK